MEVYEYVYANGIPDASCLQYIAKNPTTTDCSGINSCRSCSWPPPETDDDGMSGCTEVTNYKQYYT